MRSRALEVVGLPGVRKPRWLTSLVVQVLRRFPTPPRDARDALARTILETEALVSPLGKGLLHRGIRHVVIDTPAMRSPRWDVLPLHTLGDLEKWLALGPSTLGWFADRRGLEHHTTEPRLLNYRYVWVAKRSGGARLLEAPKARLKAVQRRILAEVLASIPPHEAAHGFRAGRSVLTHARLHVRQPVLFRFDLRAFFAEVKTPRAYGVFRAAGYPEEVARTLIALCTNRSPRSVLAAAPRLDAPAQLESLWHLKRALSAWHLPQGAPTSPALANLCARSLDVRLTALAHRAGLTYSRYADDLAFSGDASVRNAGARLTRWVEAIVRDEGFSLNRAKTRVMRGAGRQMLTGVVVNDGLNVTRERFDLLKAVLHRCRTRGPSFALRPDETIGALSARLRGEISWVASVNPGRGDKLLRAFESIDWPESSGAR